MGNRHIPSELKDIALELWDAGWDISDITYILHISRRSLYRWRNLLETYGSTKPQPAPLRGCPRAVGLAIMEIIHNVFRRNPETYLDEMQWFLATCHDFYIPISTLHTTLERMGLLRRIMKKIAIERDEHLRAEWRAGIQNPDNFSGTGVSHTIYVPCQLLISYRM